MPFFIMKTVEQIQQVILPAIEALGMELYGCEISVQANQNVLTVYVDKADGMSVDDCAKASRQVGSILDVEEVMTGRYQLEVSSPGMDRPLFRLSHYERVLGEKVAVRLQQARDNRRKLQGVVKSVAGDQITLLLEDNSELVLVFSEIEKANLISDL